VAVAMEADSGGDMAAKIPAAGKFNRLGKRMAMLKDLKKLESEINCTSMLLYVQFTYKCVLAAARLMGIWLDN